MDLGRGIAIVRDDFSADLERVRRGRGESPLADPATCGGVDLTLVWVLGFFPVWVLGIIDYWGSNLVALEHG